MKTEEKKRSAAKAGPKWEGFTVPCPPEMSAALTTLAKELSMTRAQLTRELIQAGIAKPPIIHLAMALALRRGKPLGVVLGQLIVNQLKIMRDNGELS